MLKVVRPAEGVCTPALAGVFVFTYHNLMITVDGVSVLREPAVSMREGQTLRITADIVDRSPQQNLITNATIQGQCDTPMVRHANGKPTTEEVYLQTSLVNGKVVMEGKLGSGDWKLLPERVKLALQRKQAPFELDFEPLTIIVSTPA